MFSYSKIDFQLKQNIASQNVDQSLTQNNDSNQSQSKGVIESVLDGLSGISGEHLHGDDYEEEAFKNRMEYEEKKRKKKRSRRLS